MRTSMILALACGLFFFLPALAENPEGAEDREPKRSSLREEVTVTERPIAEGQAVDEFANPRVRVSAEQVDALGAHDLPGALRRVPGVLVSRYNPIGSYGGGEGGSVYIRGQGGGRPGAEIAMLVDGIPKFVGVWTHPLMDTLSIDHAESIEVYKGPQPVEVGNMSFGAVDVTPMRRRDEGSAHGLRLAYGSFDTSVARYRFGWRDEGLDAFVSASHRRSDGDRDGAEGEVSALYARLGAALSERWTASLFVDASDGSAFDPGPAGAPRPPTTPRFDTQNTLSVATLAHAHGRWSGEAKLYYDDGEIDWRQWDGGASEAFFTRTDWENYGVRLRESLAFDGGGSLVLGFDQDAYGGRAIEDRPAIDRPLGDFRFRNRAFHAKVSRPLGAEGRLVPSIGVRYNDSRDFESQWGGELGLVYRHARGEVYARAARGFNLPGVWAAVFYEANFGRGDQWRDLEEEKIDHYEIGGAFVLGQRARIEIAVFRSEIDDALRFVPPPPPPPFFANVGSATHEGIELSAWWKASQGLDLSLSTSYLSVDPDDLPYSPEWTATAGLAAQLAPRWRLHADAEYVDERLVLNPRFPGMSEPVEDYVLVNARVEWIAMRSGPRGALKLFAAFENLLDEDYSYRPDYPMPGASLLAGLDWSLDSED